MWFTTPGWPFRARCAVSVAVYRAFAPRDIESIFWRHGVRVPRFFEQFLLSALLLWSVPRLAAP